MVHHRTRKHHKRQRGGEGECTPGTPGCEPETFASAQSGGGKKGGRGRSGRRGGRASSSGKGGGRRRGGRRSHKGGFFAGLGAALHESLVPIGLSLYTIKKSRRRSRSSRGGRDDIA